MVRAPAPDATSWQTWPASTPAACRASRCRSSDWEPSAFETRVSPINMCRKRSCATALRVWVVGTASHQLFSLCFFTKTITGIATDAPETAPPTVSPKRPPARGNTNGLP